MTSVRTGLAMTALFFKHQFVGMITEADYRNANSSISEAMPIRKSPDSGYNGTQNDVR